MMSSITRVVPSKLLLVHHPKFVCSQRCVKAHAQKDATEQLYEKTEKVVADIKDKWDKTEEKPAYVGLAVSAVVLLYILDGLVSALDNIPVISGIFKLIGVFVSSWFVYRYLVFSPDREELKQNIKGFIGKVQGKV